MYLSPSFSGTIRLISVVPVSLCTFQRTRQDGIFPQRRSSAVDRRLAISAQQTLVLVGNLLFLKLLHITAVWATRQGARGRRLTATIDRTEQRILEIWQTVTVGSQSHACSSLPTEMVVPAIEWMGAGSSEVVSAIYVSDGPLRQPGRLQLRETTTRQGQVVRNHVPSVLENMSLRASLSADMSSCPTTNRSIDEEAATAVRRQLVFQYPSSSGSAYSLTGHQRSASTSAAMGQATMLAHYKDLIPARPAFSSLGREDSKDVSMATGEGEAYGSSSTFPGKYPVSDGLDYSGSASVFRDVTILLVKLSRMVTPDELHGPDNPSP
ncbi:hypothetical protein ASPZODRAFT_129673 [Penicilliopsis zonata CBS 506.65]|uniref:Uncharacterized protein n=1 Tax=Penicilliopsis zonata CBS 506.65 TaxID=1073090 RepID=A0A1L9SQA1_9EURO|nr:hypothetical protein ASPZODRAFT_129673 [Penicilliopsis zonata CBS 506.65]OJJ49254.1 hypothetical protein ASPZODRAFT_129673 [Penicilliopsis zonata CBS 506.65]